MRNASAVILAAATIHLLVGAMLVAADRFQSPYHGHFAPVIRGHFVCYFNMGRALTACTGRLLGWCMV